ncbi:MAG: flagellar basal body rod protein FlgC [Clostridiales bacterium]|nr:flagellar basal body rod protein FlgC [Clostridiales bacterium]
MSFLSSLNISGSALTAEKLRMEIVSQNISNSNTTRTENGGPYIKKSVVFTENRNNTDFSALLKSKSSDAGLGGVVVSDIVEDQNAVKPVYDPENPDADVNGYVMTPDINTTQEMVDMISASRSYEANVTAFNAVKLMASKALEIGK